MTAVLVSYARTPFARFSGHFRQMSAVTLGAHAAREALVRAGLEGGEVQQVFVGQAIQAAAGQNPARQTSVAAGVPLTVPAMTLNAVCLSGMEAIVHGARMINSGEVDVVLAVGQESMSMAPRALQGSRAGARYGALELIDTLELDGLVDAFEHRSMGESTESQNATLGITRADQDEWAARSHSSLAASTEFLAREISPVILEGPQRETISTDDGLRVGTTVQSLSKLRPAFGQDGTITAGSSSQITDGASAVVLMRESVAADRQLKPLARILSHAFIAGPGVYLHDQPAQAINAALTQTGFSTAHLQAVEINEAFAAVAVHSVRRLGLPPEIVNTHGGAIALGHPLGASGNRITGHLALRLADIGPGAIGAAGICGGGGQGSAVVLQAM